MIVTIDGPAGAGKSSAARALATRLQFEFLDTGAMYRAVALCALRQGIALEDSRELEFSSLLLSLSLDMSEGRVLLNGEDVSTLIRTPEVSNASSVVAAMPAVRERLVELQREIAANRAIVCEGRDQGTVVFPKAGCKFFLTADPEARVRRRASELQAKGEAVDLETLRAAQAGRDLRDSSREHSPLVPAPDAIHLDSTELTLDEVIQRMEHEVRRRLGESQR
jgi:cytidylate kinase